MMSQMAGQMGMPFGRKGSSRKPARARQAGWKKKAAGVQRHRRCAARSARACPRASPTGQHAKGLDELAPGLADIDLSKLKFPKN